MENLNKFPPQNITSLEAGERQLKEAIWLFFESRDPVAIHTLTKAAHEIFFRLGEPHNATSMIWNPVFMKSKWKKEWIRAMNAAGNFFKHAGEKPKKKFNFKPQLTHFFICDAIRLYAQLTSDLFYEGKVFNTWFVVNYPQTLEEEALIQMVRQEIGPKVPSTSDFDGWLYFLKNH